MKTHVDVIRAASNVFAQTGTLPTKLIVGIQTRNELINGASRGYWEPSDGKRPERYAGFEFILDSNKSQDFLEVAP